MECKKIVAIFGVVVFVIVITVLLVKLLPQTGKDNAAFNATFMKKCETFSPQNTRCEEILDIFQQAYVGKESCGFSEQDYDPVFAKIPFTHPCNKTMLWSNTKEMVHDFTGKTRCLTTLEDTLLGSVLDDLEWCGKKGSNETYVTLCKHCEKNPVNSFWKKASAKFAEYACGEVTAMLNNETNKPYDPDSVFAIEVKNLRPPVKRLNIVLVSNNDAHRDKCDCDLDLVKDLDKNITCTCRAVTRSHIKECKKDTCGTCW